MFITRKYLSRRCVLRSLGASVALPLLDAMVPAAVPLNKTAAAGKQRFVAIEIVHGCAGSTQWGRERHYWSPERAGTAFELTPILANLEPLREYVTIISNTELPSATSLSVDEDGPMADHARSATTFLTATHPKHTVGEDIQAGPSLDQILARRFGGKTRIPSLQLCIENLESLTGDCGHGYSCAYQNTISWASPMRPLPMERAPRAIFDRLFDVVPSGTKHEQGRHSRSILDGMDDQTRRLRRLLSVADRNLVNEYLDEVRAIEQQICDVERTNIATSSSANSAPLSVPDSFEKHVQVMFRLLVLAFRADLTRVCTFKLGIDRSSRIYPESGIAQPFHALSHHREEPDKIKAFAQLNAYHVSKVAAFLSALKASHDGQGNLLQQSLVLYGSPMGDSHVHEHRYLPVFLSGHACGHIRGHCHVSCQPAAPLANVLLTIARRLGADLDRIGDSTGEIAI
jgi:hypothetical protein